MTTARNELWWSAGGAWATGWLSERQRTPLTEAQEEVLDEALWQHEAIWSQQHIRSWLYREAVRRGWLLGPA